MKVFKLVLMLGLATRTVLFNIVAHRPLVLTGNDKSHFGYSVAIWQSSSETKLVVGAPQDTGEKMAEEKQGGEDSKGYARIISGEVYLCDPREGHTLCSSHRTKLPPLYNHSNKGDVRLLGSGVYNFGLGSTLLTGSSNNPPLLMCAPRESYYMKKGNEGFLVPEGECFLLRPNQTQPQRLRPTSTNVQYCGFSAAFDKDDTVVYLGCPSIINGFQVDITQPEGYVLKFDLDAPEYPHERHLGQECGQESHYEGWAMTQRMLASSSVVVTSCGNQKRVVELEMMTQLLEGARDTGELLGSVLESCDLDGDGEDEVLVGAPLGKVHTSSGYTEPGKVIILGTKGTKHTMEGTEDFSRFGTSIACLGDLNSDGYQDVAVGAPQHSGGGAVFIFLGSVTGIRSSPSQVLQLAEFSSSRRRGFGYSLAGGKDVDGNGYPDLLVGAPMSDAAFFFRTAQVLQLQVSMFEFSTSQVDLQERNCLEEGEEWALRVCFHLRVQLGVLGHQGKFDIEVRVQVVLDGNYPRQRIFFRDSTSQHVQETVHIVNRIHQLEYHIYAEELATEEEAVALAGADLQVSLVQVHPQEHEDLLPVVEVPQPSQQWTSTTSVRFLCGSDPNTCVAKTNIRLTLDNHRIIFVVGEETVEARATLTVEKSTAFELTLQVEAQYGLVLYECRALNTNITFHCTINGTCSTSYRRLRPGSKFNILIVWRQNVERLLNYTQTQEESILQTDLSVWVLNQRNHTDNHRHLHLLPRVSPIFDLSGESQPESLSVITFGIPVEALQGNTTIYPRENNETEATITHTYTLINLGLISLIHTQIEIHWPLRNRTDGVQFFLLKMPRVTVPPGATLECHNTSEALPTGNALGQPVDQMVSCHTFECYIHRCEVRNLRPEGKVVIHLDAVIITSALKNSSGFLRVESWVSAEVMAPNMNLLQGANLLQHVEVSTQLVLPLVSSSQPPAWILVLAIHAGLVLLSVLVAVLYKMGFFKRKLLNTHRRMRREQEDISYTEEVGEDK